jgi:hypothetical protein
MKKLLVALAVLVVAGCASVTKMESGTQALGDRLVLTLEGAWNHVNAPGLGPAQVWTMEGLPLDRLLIYPGIKDGEAIHASGGGAKRKDLVFRSGMQADQVVALFEGMLTGDGSSFKLVKLEPAAFGGEKGYRFEYALVRRGDGVQLSGVGYAAVSKGELFALVYQAPRMTFFARHKDRVESIARSARVKS